MLRHPNNAEGTFWIDQESCVGCQVCTGEAPDNITYDASNSKSYIFKQPENDVELAAVREAVELCPVLAPKEDQIGG